MLDDGLRANAWSAIHSTYQGMFDVCAYHEAYCTGEYRQYDNFYNELPRVPDGLARPSCVLKGTR